MIAGGHHHGNLWSHQHDCQWRSPPKVGKVTLKSNGDEALSDESLKKSNGDEALNDHPL
jgi:hypothetical protein